MSDGPILSTAPDADIFIPNSLFLGCMLVHVSFVASSLVIFVLFRRRPHIRHRCFHLTILIAIGNVLLAAWCALRVLPYQWNSRLLCTLESWFLGTGLPLWILGNMGRWIYIVSYSLSAASQSAQADTEVEKANTTGKGRFANVGASLMANPTHLHPSSTALRKTSVDSDNTTASHGPSSILSSTTGSSANGPPHWGIWLTDRKLSLILVAIALWHLLTLYLVTLFEKARVMPSECLKSWTNSAFLVPAILYLIIPSFSLLWYSRGLQDSFGIKRELILFSTITFLTAILLPFIYLLASSNEDVRDVVLACLLEVYLLATYSYGVIRPLYLSGQTRRAPIEMTRGGFLELLADPARMAEFKAYAVSDFSVENAVFYERVTIILGTLEKGQGEARRERRIRRLQDIHLSSSAPLMVNITGPLNRELQRAFQDGGMPEDALLRQAREEIITLMYQCTYPGFVAWKHEHDVDSVVREDRDGLGRQGKNGTNSMTAGHMV